MSLAWATEGSELQGNADLRDDIVFGLDWMYENLYNEEATQHGNWYDRRIGGPAALNDAVILL